MHDGRVESGLDALVQEYRIEHLAGRRVEAERDVGQSEDGRHAGQFGLDGPDALNRLDPVVAALLHAGGQGKRQGVEEKVLGRQTVALDGDVTDIAGGPQLPLGRACLAFFIDAGAHHGGAELPGQAQERVEPGAGPVAFLEVDRVEDGRAADPFQGGPDNGALGRVDHERHAGLGGEPAGHLGHVGYAVGAGVVDAHVDDVRALLDLVAGHGDAGVPIGLEHGLAEALGAVGVGALADHQERGVLAEGNRGCRWRRPRAPRPGCGRPEWRRRSARPPPPGARAWYRSIRRPPRPRTR